MPTYDTVSDDAAVLTQIEISDPDVLLWWMRHLACSERDLRLAVTRVGSSAREVRYYLGKSDHSETDDGRVGINHVAHL